MLCCCGWRASIQQYRTDRRVRQLIDTAFSDNESEQKLAIRDLCKIAEDDRLWGLVLKRCILLCSGHSSLDDAVLYIVVTELPIPLLSTLEHVLSKVIASHTSYSLSQRRNISIAIQGLVTKCGANAYGLLAQESLLLMLMEMLREPSSFPQPTHVVVAVRLHALLALETLYRFISSAKTFLDEHGMNEVVLQYATDFDQELRFVSQYALQNYLELSEKMKGKVLELKRKEMSNLPYVENFVCLNPRSRTHNMKLSTNLLEVLCSDVEHTQLV